MDEFNYASTLTRCMLVSAAALVAGVALPAVPHIFFFGAALAPLVWYHTMFLRPRAGEGLNQAAIDSVYYYGFLITVGALGATALDLSLHGIGKDFAPVAFQFGLGLLATGYAVWARVHLTASVKILDEEELRELMGQQIARSRELLVNMELVSSSFENFSTTLLQKSGQFAATVEAQAKASIEGAMRAFEEGIGALSQQAQLALNDIRAIVNDVTFGAERETLRNSVTAMVEAVASLGEGLEQLSASTSAGATSVGEFAGSLERVNTASTRAAEKLAVLGEDKGVVVKFSEAVHDGAEQIHGFVLAADVAAASVTTLSDNVSAAHAPVEAIGKTSQQAADKLEKLSDVFNAIAQSHEAVSRVNTALMELGTLSEGSGDQLQALQQKLESLHATLEQLNGALIDSTGGLKDAMISTSEALEGALQRAVGASEELAARVAV